ncbi:MAG: hypothetical protein Greene041662_139 [Candidatus Peregrinibacteria bacterium Greene0416_62]|nr:MAG: hypothetical protein Greene041662_139 [Candidatus Peregrinibacteria bacterium Greene0416_62]
MIACRIAEVFSFRQESFVAKKKPPYGGFFISNIKLRLADSVLERLSSLEGRNLHCGDGDALRGVSGVDSYASCALANLERSETRERDMVSFLKLLRHEGRQSLEGGSRSTLGDTRGIRDHIDDILLGHGTGRKKVDWLKVYYLLPQPQAKKTCSAPLFPLGIIMMARERGNK